MSRLPKAQECQDVQCDVCARAGSVLFTGVEPGLLREAGKAIDTCRLRRGAVVYRMGERGNAILTLREGVVKLVQYLADGTRRIVRLARPADVVGLEALLGQPYQHDAIVEQEATFCRIPVAVVRRLQEHHPQLYEEQMRRWQQALAQADTWLTALSTGTARQRLARLLLQLIDAQGEGLCPLFGRRDIAAMLGLTTETASRVTAEFKREGLLVERDGGFRCPRAVLRRIAEY